MKKDLNEYRKQFEPPKIDAWNLFLIFLFPLTIAIIPVLFALDNVTSYNRTIIALCVLCAVLTIYCFHLILKIYSNSYTAQVQELKLDMLEEQIEKLQKKI